MKEFLTFLNTELGEIYSEKNELHSVAYLLLEKITGRSRTQLLTHPDYKLTESELQICRDFIVRLKKNEPIQYILGVADFFGLQFLVSPAVLIPRPETEELVEWIIDTVNQNLTDKNEKINVLDIGTGSGCIALSLAYSLKNSIISAVDISTDALEIAKQNAKMHNMPIDFFQADILLPPQMEKKWDIIVSNPPYIPFPEQKTMSKNVVDFEPAVALFVEDENPLIFYQKIGEFAINHLAKNGNLFFETHYLIADKCQQLFDEMGFETILKKDISGNNRMIQAISRNT